MSHFGHKSAEISTIRREGSQRNKHEEVKFQLYLFIGHFHGDLEAQSTSQRVKTTKKAEKAGSSHPCIYAHRDIHTISCTHVHTCTANTHRPTHVPAETRPGTETWPERPRVSLLPGRTGGSTPRSRALYPPHLGAWPANPGKTRDHFPVWPSGGNTGAKNWCKPGQRLKTTRLT